MVKKVITNLDSSRASGCDYIPVVVLKNCESELSYTPSESCSSDCWKISSVVPVFKNVGKRSTAKNYHPVSLLSVVSKVFEKPVNNRIVDHLEKCSLFYGFQYGFRFSQSTVDLLTVVSDRIARAFNRSGATRAVALDISKAFDKVWHAGLLYKLKSYGISRQIFGLISSFLNNRWLWVVLVGKSSQECLVNAGVSKVSILGPTLFLLYINDLSDDVICNIAISDDDTTLYSNCDQASVATAWIGFWTWRWCTRHWTGTGSGLLISMLEKCSWLHLTGLITLVLLVWKWMGLLLRKNHLLRW